MTCISVLLFGLSGCCKDRPERLWPARRRVRARYHQHGCFRPQPAVETESRTAVGRRTGMNSFRWH